MCGIAGAVAISHSEPSQALKNAVTKMMTALRHRGPDDQGISEHHLTVGDFRADVLLASQRLAIIDRSAAGHQPMVDDSGLAISYNGEVYNFRELRKEIGDEFGPWRSATDTEVVLKAYRKWGCRAFKKLRGMFALAIWDAQKGELILARDPFGIKPLYYVPKSEIRNSFFLFASEIKALLASDLIQRNLSVEGLRSFLSYGSVQAPSTIIDGVRCLMPGHYVIVRPRHSGLESEEVSYLEKHLTADDQTPSSRDEMLRLLRAKLEDTVKLHLVSDVPLGVFLSGGMDSSALVALMSRVASERPKTFSVVFDEKKFDEAGHARLVAEKFHSEHREIRLNEGQLLALLPNALAAMDQPTIDGINTYVVSKAVKEAGITVALSGLGGDELFAGYPSFRRARRLERASTLSRGLLRSAATLGGFAPGQSRQREKLRQLAESNGDPDEVYRITRQLFAPGQVMELMDVDQQPGEGRSHDSSNLITSTLSGALGLPFTADSADAINRISELELSLYMSNTLLRDTDSMSMAHSLEVRVPFVDVDVARLVLSAPGNWKLNGRTPKPLLADALRDVLPERVLERPKMGFTLPFERWMRSRLRREISTVLEGRDGLCQAGLDAGATTEVWRSFLGKPRAVGWSRPWALYVLRKWCERNGVAN